MKKYKPMHPVRRLRKMLAEVQQIRRDIQYWNKTRLDAPPFDVGRDVVMERALQAAIASWGTEEFKVRCDEVMKLSSEYAIET